VLCALEHGHQRRDRTPEHQVREINSHPHDNKSCDVCYAQRYFCNDGAKTFLVFISHISCIAFRVDLTQVACSVSPLMPRYSRTFRSAED
jgi:hypothetical protein